MKPFLVPSAKPDSVRGQYRPKTPQDEALLKQYNDLQATIVRLPDVNNPDASIYVDMPFKAPLALYDRNVAQECERLVESVLKAMMQDRKNPCIDQERLLDVRWEHS
jgi:hypothetical protein